ncbi:PpsA9 [Desulforapulum autotrophicum HRM2]|uniref:Phosphoenolpyruvate synthase n=1 Tax=Desulforapulum autotrophicum (strain ATCC 43914 / DSM 3382 / VKM B-1955 / HRM2) TaxID=177437 RepID=C0QG82_DESAH|nr:PEP/pyruvate-binding domain-containing protein [Desulforapulum autotrophicum]ACN17661.1 PpsA9 [Desulforapulum autotrophicum HRM2]
MWLICRHWFKKLFMPGRLLQEKHVAFRKVLQLDSLSLDFLADLESHLLGQDPADDFRINNLCDQAIEAVGAMAEHLYAMNPPAYGKLLERHAELTTEIKGMMGQVETQSSPPYILPLQQAADYPEIAGGKAANLSAAERAGVIIPSGFVITANAFHRFICDNKLENELIRQLRQVHADDNDTIIRITGELQALILGCEVPADISDHIEQSVESLMPADRLAVRSSALAEDGLVSFAGQYASELDVPASKVIAAYKRVIAGKYCPRAVTYRIRHGLSDTDTAMAVLVVPMIQPQTSGVMYTLDPGTPARKDSLGVYAVAGLAEGLVDGSRTPERYHLPREDSLISPQILSAHDDSLLNTTQLQQLRTWGLQLETYFGYPQDIEWTLDNDGLTVLQCRRLHQKKDPHPAIVPAVDLTRVLYSNLHCASAGISCGPVFFAPTGKTFRNIPPGSVVLTPTLRSSLSQFLDRVVGVIAANGSRASHFSSVARERGIPVLVGGEVELAAGQVVTVDAVSGRIFNGCVNTVLQNGKLHFNKDFPAEKYVKLAARTTHLSLTNPDGDTFTPAQCHSLHDMVRFCHEKSVWEMFHLVGKKGRGLGKARKLVTDLPLVIYILDLEKRTSVKAPARLTLAEISSVPMQSYWQGMSDSRIFWDNSQHHVDWGAFDQISGGIFFLDTKLLASYAIVSRDYLHLNIRFGYHFSIVDAICGEQASTNYLNFRFKGGGAAHRQKLFRLEFIDKVLTAFGFETASRGDMLDAAFARASQSETKLALTRLGMLLAATRLMDMRLTKTSQVTEEVEKFLILAKETKSF